MDPQKNYYPPGFQPGMAPNGALQNMRPPSLPQFPSAALSQNPSQNLAGPFANFNLGKTTPNGIINQPPGSQNNINYPAFPGQNASQYPPASSQQNSFAAAPFAARPAVRLPEMPNMSPNAQLPNGPSAPRLPQFPSPPSLNPPSFPRPGAPSVAARSLGQQSTTNGFPTSHSQPALYPQSTATPPTAALQSLDRPASNPAITNQTFTNPMMPAFPAAAPRNVYQPPAFPAATPQQNNFPPQITSPSFERPASGAMLPPLPNANQVPYQPPSFSQASTTQNAFPTPPQPFQSPYGTVQSQTGTAVSYTQPQQTPAPFSSSFPAQVPQFSPVQQPAAPVQNVPGAFPTNGYSSQNVYQNPALPSQPQFGAPVNYGQPGFPAAQPAAQPESGRVINLLQSRKILPGSGVETPNPVLRSENFRGVNCSPDIFRCTLNVIPKTTALLQKSRLPLGILIHPYKDLSNLQVLSCNTIVRCRSCRSYINPFVTFIDQSRWKCNLCDRTNDLPQEFYHDPITHTVGDPQRRPEVRTATIEYIAPSEYSLRPPQPAVYVFLLDISFNAIETRYLDTFCERLSSLLERLPGDARTQIGFVAFDRGIHFFQLEKEWRMLTVADIDDVFVPTTEGVLVRLHENIGQIRSLLEKLPSMFKSQRETHSCLGAAVQIAFKMISSTGGRITVVQTCLPSIGPGALKSREDPNLRAAKEVKNLQPATDFYKTLALECSGSQVAVDLFLLAGQYADLASLSGIARYSGGSIHYYPGFSSASNVAQLERFNSQLTRYLTRKIGFEAVMRVRCTNGLSMHSFHGNFFVRSTDLLSLPNINPDAGYAVQVKMDENLTHASHVSFQSALLYTSSKGERRIRVHTLCLPVTESLSEIFASADQEAIASLVSKIAAERALNGPIADVRDGIVYACEDALNAFTNIMRPQHGQLLAPQSLRLLPLFTQALLKNPAFRVGVSTTVDLRTFFILFLKCAPLFEAMLTIYPHLYALHNIENAQESLDEEGSVAKLERLHLSYENIDRRGAYLLESAIHMILYVTKNVDERFCRDVFGVPSFDKIPDRSVELPELETELSARIRAFVSHRCSQRPLHPILEVIKEDSKDKIIFLQYLHDDRLESSLSYFEFITQVAQKVKAP